MENNLPYLIVQCLKPTCRFRYPAASVPPEATCPKCGSPVHVASFPVQVPAGNASQPPAGKIDVLLDNIRSAYNVGSILRTSDAVNIAHIHLCGTTPTPDNPKVRKTALGAEFSTPWSMAWNALDTALARKAQGFFILSLELAPSAVPLFALQPEQVKYPLLLIVGNEVSGVDPEILAVSDAIVQIPMLGRKGSINVATAYGVAVYFLRYLESKTGKPA